jgi:hypothetical protein
MIFRPAGIVILVVVAGVAACAVAVSRPSHAPHAVSRTDPPASDKPWFGALQAPPQAISALSAARVGRLVLELSWSSYEPEQGRYDPAYIAEQRSLILQMHQQGVAVELDLGLQYPPAWVFGLPGATRFRNQFGQDYQGGLGSDSPNAVFDPAVRAAESDYIHRIAGDLGASSFVAVRIGGLLTGELRYPSGNYGGNTGALWLYDSAAQKAAPYPGWRPGTGSGQQAAASLQYYFDSLTSYEKWMLGTAGDAFPHAELQVLFPSWGIRPGQVADAVAAGLHGTTAAEQGDMISAGLDWTAQVAALAPWKPRGVVYTTWLDAPSHAGTPQLESPIAYLASLAATWSLPLAGENTGNPGTQALDLSLARARQFHLTGVMWMSARNLLSGAGGLSLNDFAAAIKAVHATRATQPH